MDQRAVARMLAVGRIGIGFGLLVAPTLVAKGWGGPVAAEPGAKFFLRALGGRDLLLGVGSLRALGEGDGSAEGWVRASALADATDAAAATIAFRHLPSPGRWITVAMAGTAAAVGLNAADDLG
jgi:hypothetical protein